MIVYGKNVFSQIKNDPDAIQEIYIQKGMQDKTLVKTIENLRVPTYFKSRAELDKIAKDSHHQGIVCKVKEIQTFDISYLVKHAKKLGLIVALDGVQDPHNVGAILRSCDCTGVDGLILTKHKSAGLTPTAIKTSTGAAYTVPVAVVTNLSKTLQQLKKEGYWIAGTDMDNARDYREGMYDSPTVLVIGSEGKGISPLVKKQCDYMISLPMVGKISSLNASVACAVVLYQIYSSRNPL